jgi:hypothetical protein
VNGNRIGGKGVQDEQIEKPVRRIGQGNSRVTDDHLALRRAVAQVVKPLRIAREPRASNEVGGRVGAMAFQKECIFL